MFTIGNVSLITSPGFQVGENPKSKTCAREACAREGGGAYLKPKIALTNEKNGIKSTIKKQ